MQLAYGTHGIWLNAWMVAGCSHECRMLGVGSWELRAKSYEPRAKSQEPEAGRLHFTQVNWGADRDLV